MIQYIKSMIDQWLIDWGVAQNITMYLRVLILLVALTLIAFLIFWVTKKVFITYIYKLILRTPAKWDDLLAEQGTLNSLAHIIPAVIVKITAPIVFSEFPKLLPLIMKLTNSYLVIVGLLLVLSFLKVIESSLSKSESFKEKPLNSYFQVVRIILYLGTGINVVKLRD